MKRVRTFGIKRSRSANRTEHSPIAILCLKKGEKSLTCFFTLRRRTFAAWMMTLSCGWSDGVQIWMVGVFRWLS